MNASVLARAAHAGEMARVVELLAAQLADHGIEVAELDATVAAVLADPSLGRLLVAARGPRLVGVAYLSFTFTLEYGGKTAWLEELYVVPEERERGVGTVLLTEALAAAGGAGCRAVDLDVDANHTRAARLYLRHGFGWLDRRRMCKMLRA